MCTSHKPITAATLVGAPATELLKDIHVHRTREGEIWDKEQRKLGRDQRRDSTGGTAGRKCRGREDATGENAASQDVGWQGAGIFSFGVRAAERIR